MCAIAGIVSEGVLPNRIHDMLAKMIHRGPDDSGTQTITSGNYQCTLGHNRLSIIGLAGGHQPMQRGGVTLVFNGEIYNYQELAASIGIESDSDTKVILELYLRLGEQAFSKLRGMYSIALLDEGTKRLYLARDTFGIKPIFYRQTEKKLEFASELKALVNEQEVIDADSIDQFVALGYLTLGRTIYRGIKKVPRDTLLCFSLHDLSCTSKLITDIDKPHTTETELDHVLQESVFSHQVSDVPISYMLSGGVDSGLVFGLSKVNKDNQMTTFTLQYPNSQEMWDEAKIAEAFSESRLVHHQTIKGGSFSLERLEQIIAMFDEPFADTSVFPSHDLYEVISKKFKVSLSGLGGDEFFGGYYRYRALDLWQKLRRTGLVNAAKLLGQLLRQLSHNRFDNLIRLCEGLDKSEAVTYVNFISLLNQSNRRRLYSDHLAMQLSDTTDTDLITHYQALKSEHEKPSQNAMRFDIDTYLPDDVLHLGDILSMKYSLEVRFPLVDNQVYSASRRDKSSILFKTKKQLRRIGERVLPESYLSKRKQGFYAPVRHVISELGADYISANSLVLTSYFNTNELEMLFRSRETHYKAKFNILVLMIWIVQNNEKF